MKRIIFYVEDNWAFGSIHNELCKHLWPYGINANVLDWAQSYSVDEMQSLLETTDLFVTIFSGWQVLNGDYGIPPDKTVLIAHGKYDFEQFAKTNTTSINEFYNIGCVSSWLQTIAPNYITRDINLTPVAINYEAFKCKPSTNLQRIGFASSIMKHPIIKRGHLITECSQRANLPLSIAFGNTHSYLTMPSFYKSVDAIITASTEEGAGLPSLEAGASGKLVISTRVGHWDERIGESGGIVVPTPDNEFLNATTEILNYYKKRPDAYYNKCLAIQQHAETYDWKYVIDKWVEILL